jgi:hypothetical protein
VAFRIGLAVAVLLGLALVVASREVPEGLAGRPEISVEFPATSDPGSVQTATFTIRNPGPNEMQSVFLVFARVGPAEGGGEIPIPIVDPGAKHVNPAIVSISPEPEASSIDAIVFRFGSLGVGETMTVSFDLRMPDATGPAANSVTAYPGEDPERAKGVRLDTEVGG